MRVSLKHAPRGRSLRACRDCLPAILLGAAALLLLGAAILLVPGDASARGCPGAHLRPTHHNAKKIRAALLCLHNRAARARDPPAASNVRLTRAAGGHSRRMVRARFFSHVAPSGAHVASARAARATPGAARSTSPRTSAGAPVPRHAAADLPGLDGVPAPPGARPQRALPLDRDRRRAGAPLPGWPARPPTQSSRHPLSREEGRRGRPTSIGAPDDRAHDLPDPPRLVADVQPLRALHYDLARTGGMAPVAAPPYDVIDAEQRARAARPLALQRGRDRPARGPAATPTSTPPSTLAAWRAEGVVVRDAEPALWALEQDYTGPDGRTRTRHGLLRPRAGRGLRRRPHPPARAHAPRAQGGPPAAHARHAARTSRRSSRSTTIPGRRLAALEPAPGRAAFGEATDADGTPHRLWRIGDPAAIAAVRAALADAELLIADGHHRYETARVYARGERAARAGTAMCSCASSRSGIPG